MFVYFGKRFSAVIAGRRIKQVTCDNCQSQFSYELVRTASGVGHSPYNTDNEGAAFRADNEARQNLDRRLSQEVELVPCPSCNWVNEGAVRQFQASSYRKLPWLSVLILLVGCGAAFPIGLLLRNLLGRSSNLPTAVTMTLVAISLTSPLWIFLVRSFLRAKIDPNRTFPQRPKVPVGTPPAMIETVDPQSNTPVIKRIPSCDDTTGDLQGWAVFRPGQIQFPPICCVCMAPATTPYKSSFKVDHGSDLEVGLCDACASRIRRRWWPIALAVALGTLALIIALCALAPVDEVGQFILGGIVAIFAVPAAVATIPNRFTRPYRFEVLDSQRRVYAFRAANQRHTDIVVAQIERHISGQSPAVRSFGE